jgi:hypothetical protein
MRTFKSGATRDQDETKLDYEGFYSPSVMKRFAEYMNEHRQQPNGSMRSSDNWQKGMPLEAYMKSAFRHFMDWWAIHRDEPADEDLEVALCALIFNAQGYLHEVIKAND